MGWDRPAALLLKDFLIIILIKYPYRAEMVRAQRRPVRPVVIHDNRIIAERGFYCLNGT